MSWVNALFEAVGAYLAWCGARSLKRESVEARAALGWSCLWACECVPYYLSVGDRLNAGLASLRCLGLAFWCLR